MKLKHMLYAGIFIFYGCGGSSDKTRDEIIGVQSILWTQFSAEAEALYLQGYNIASDILTEFDDRSSELPLAVTLDLDETVLDNSPFSVEMIKQEFDYSEEKWSEWCERREARALPGALAFTKLADSLGFEVFYISNRSAELLEATIDNLNALHFPNADSEHLLLKEGTSSKDGRREVVCEHHEIILMLGDNLGDFDGLFDDRSANYGKNEVRENAFAFGTQYILFPNSMYGSWQRGVFPDGMPSEKEILKKLRAYE